MGETEVIILEGLLNLRLLKKIRTASGITYGDFCVLVLAAL
jgi:hypothetical protein